jgi:hypothetical protein
VIRRLSPTRLVVIGVMLALVVGVVAEPEFLAIVAPGLVLGLVVALVLHFTNRDAMPPREDSPGPSWGPNMSKISFSGGAGLIFTLGSMAIFFVGVPPVRWFLALSLPLGIGVGLLLHFAHRD